MKITKPDGTEIDSEQLREFGTLMFPNCDDTDLARTLVEAEFPAIRENIERMYPGCVWVNDGPEVVVGNPAHTPGPHAPVGWYAMIEVPA